MSLFLDVLPLFVRSLDIAYFETLSLNTEDAVQARVYWLNDLWIVAAGDISGKIRRLD